MNRFETITEKQQDYTVYVIRNLQTGECARIVPALGGNCLELKLAPSTGGKAIAVIDDMKFVGKTKEQPSRYGIPVLFPWPSGIPEGRFMFEGKVHDANEPDNKRSAHHGLVNRASWRVVRSDCDNAAAWLTCEVSDVDCGDAGKRFGFPFVLEMTWKLTETGLQIEMKARNTGSGSMPIGMGLHPYFTVPFGQKGSRGECRLAATVVRQWDLDVTVPFKAGEAAPEKVFLADMEFDPTGPTGRPLADVKFNEVYQASFDVAGETRASVADPANDVALAVTASKDFGTWVIYTPPDRDAISLEPWTLTPNGFNLAASGVKESGMITLQPGQAWKGEVRIHLD